MLYGYILLVTYLLFNLNCNCVAVETLQTDDWRMPLDEFSSKKRGLSKADRGLPQSVRRYYKTQDELITAFEDLQFNAANYENTNADAARLLQQAELLARITFFCNLVGDMVAGRE